VLSYLKARAAEKSTWAAIGLGVPIAAVLDAPWSYVSLAVAVIGAFVPTSTPTEE
jgi:hypothetical protein